MVNARLLSKSGSFITRVVRESEPRAGKDGLLTVTTEAIVDVKELQKAVNRMSREERIDVIRPRGDPRISVRILVRSEGGADAPSRPSPIAENIVKAEIKSFGFRTWSDESLPPAAETGPDLPSPAKSACAGCRRARSLGARDRKYVVGPPP